MLTATQTALIIVSSITCGVALLLLSLSITLSKLKKDAMETADRELAGYNVVCRDDFANCFGFYRTKAGVRRGNGILALTDTELAFFPFIGKKELIPFNSITDIDVKKSHRGKIIFQDLLGIEYTINGKEVSVAWYTKQLNEFVVNLEKATNLKAH